MRLVVDRTRTIVSRAAARLRRQEGFTMLVVLGALLIGTAFTLVAIAAADGDIKPARDDQDSKAAYAAAEAGIAYYRYQLEKNPEFYRECTNGTSGPIVQKWSGTGPDTRDSKWRSLPSSSTQYAVELLPASGYEASGCVTGVGASMIDWRTGTFSVRSTGKSRGKSRSIVATFRRKGFSDYVYFTDYETVDPQILAYEAGRSPSANDALCARYNYGASPRTAISGCINIPFITGDAVNGPLHTNDELQYYGSPSLGRNSLDRIETSAPSYRAYLGGSATPIYPGGGSLLVNQPVVSMPPSLPAAELAATVLPANTYAGQTSITVGTTSYTVTNGGSTQTKALPANGLIYVTGPTCTYNPGNPYPTPPNTACADVRVQGTYRESLTIAAQNDIIITGNLTREAGASGVMGLVADQFVRIYHPLVGGAGCPGGTDEPPPQTNAAGSTMNIQIDAAILALQHSFTVDNHNCGASLGTMRITGAIAQKFRGFVYSRTGSNAGYLKDYNYDERMKNTGPPSFIQPTGAAWSMLRYNEQIPAR